MKLFFDTSALIKLFHDEIGTENITEIVNDPQNKMWISELTVIEFINFTYRFYSESRINDKELSDLICEFDKECDRFNIVSLNEAVIKEARELLTKLGKSIPLRSLDALQLASYNLVYEDNKDWAFVTSDIRLIQIFQITGGKVINP
ncbi:MAG: type II toxin-antitoxin system VapC family toxin [Candidatus Poribacteria bacterium]